MTGRRRRSHRDGANRSSNSKTRTASWRCRSIVKADARIYGLALYGAAARSPASQPAQSRRAGGIVAAELTACNRPASCRQAANFFMLAAASDFQRCGMRNSCER